MAFSTGYNNTNPIPGRTPPNYGVSGNQTVTPDTLNRTFDYGQGGTIEMKPIDQVAQSTLAPGQPAQQQMETAILSTDPKEIIQRQHEQNLQQIENSLLQAKDEVTKKTRYKIGELEQERELKINQLQRKYNRPLKEGETRQDLQKEFQMALADLNDQVDLAKMRMSSKIQPDIDLLDTQGKQAIQEIQQQHRDKMLQLETINALVEDGTITDPMVAKRKQLQVAGIDVPITGLRTPEATPYQMASNLRTMVNEIDRRIKKIDDNPYEYDPTTGEPIDRSQQRVDLLTLRNEIQQKLVKDVLPQIYPQYAGYYERFGRLTAAAEYARGKTNPTTGQPVGTIGTQVANAKTAAQPNNKLDVATARAILQEAGGDKELARKIAQSRGYKL